MLVCLEWRVNYGVMERLFSTGWTVEAPPDISMPVCLKANFTLHAPGTKPSKNLHFNRIPSPFTTCFWKPGPRCCTLFHISYPGCIISLCQLLSLHCNKRRGKQQGGWEAAEEGKGGSYFSIILLRIFADSWILYYLFYFVIKSVMLGSFILHFSLETR